MAPVLQRLAKNVVMVNGLTGHMAIKNKDATSKHAKIIHHSGTAEVHTSSECVQGCGKDNSICKCNWTMCRLYIVYSVYLFFNKGC